jgi:hypothetical protein
MKIYLLIFTSLFLLISCKEREKKSEDAPVARVYESYLYKSDLSGIVPSGLASADSAALVKDFIDKWIRKQLLLLRAEENLSNSEKNVEKQIEEYRTSLLIYKYEQNIIQQKLDTTVSEEDIVMFYNENTSNFILNQNLVKATFIKVPKTAPDIDKIRRWYISDSDRDIKEVEIYCYKYAAKYDYFNEDWVEFRYILNEMPEINTTPQNLLKSKNAIEMSDSAFYYFLRIYDYKLEGTVAPLEFEKSNIISIMLNKRKIQKINQLESDIYNDALNHGNFTIY